MRPIDDEDSPAKLDPNYDESEDEEDVNWKSVGDDGKPSEPSSVPITPRGSLPIDSDDEDIDMASAELGEVLADGPIVRKAT